MLDTTHTRALKLRGHHLTTAEILYHLPDHPSLLQTYLWQDFDIAPHFPALRRFLAFWKSNLEGPLHSVRVAHAPLVGGPQMRLAEASFQLH